MNVLHRVARDPWWDDGTGVRRSRTRRRIIGGLALVLAIGACGMVVASWIQLLLPAIDRLLG